MTLGRRPDQPACQRRRGITKGVKQPLMHGQDQQKMGRHQVQCSRWSLSTLATDATGELDVLGHDGDALSVDGAEVDILEEANKVGFSSFLQGKNSGGLEAEVGLEVLRYLAHEALEGQLADEKLG